MRTRAPTRSRWKLRAMVLSAIPFVSASVTCRSKPLGRSIGLIASRSTARWRRAAATCCSIRTATAGTVTPGYASPPPSVSIQRSGMRETNRATRTILWNNGTGRLDCWSTIQGDAQPGGDAHHRQEHGRSRGRQGLERGRNVEDCKRRRPQDEVGRHRPEDRPEPHDPGPRSRHRQSLCSHAPPPPAAQAPAAVDLVERAARSRFPHYRRALSSRRVCRFAKYRPPRALAPKACS